MKLVILITGEVEHGLAIAEAWQKAGAPGVTILRTHGLYSLQQEVHKGNVELPRMVASMAAAMAHVIDHMEEKGHLLISVVEDDMVDTLIDEATNILGDLTLPNNGVLFVLPVDRAVGVVRHDRK
ncbi:MAG: hypothetical protein H6670_01375 [Anaerolineaceae bacterium]|nr:hypothetical protein [Anaerolineaceae bacterium]